VPAVVLALGRHVLQQHCKAPFAADCHVNDSRFSSAMLPPQGSSREIDVENDADSRNLGSSHAISDAEEQSSIPTAAAKKSRSNISLRYSRQLEFLSSVSFDIGSVP
jgi:hypothetical protein